MAGTLCLIIQTIRYRFLLFAGLLPYGLGIVLAFHLEQQFNLALFLMGLSGLLFALIGVEAFNEFFDWRFGSDRVFQLNPKPVTTRTFLIGLAAFSVAGLMAILLTLKLGIAIIIISFMGFLAALFYLAPPLKLAYRGWGEVVIALSYGPLMMLGSYYLQTKHLDSRPLIISVIPALLLFAISIMNEVPDYLQDRIVGKRNICVRLGREKVIRLYGLVLILFYALLLGGLISKNLPPLTWLGLICVPISLVSYTTARQSYENPQRFISAIRCSIIQYLIIISVLITAYLI